MYLRLLHLLLALFVASTVSGKVVRVEIEARSSVLDGKSFGPAGAYERIRGKIFYEINPDNSANNTIVDLEYAPTNDRGRVEFSADLYLIKPVNPQAGNGTVLVEAPNRGRKGLLSEFNLADWSTAESGGDPHPGDGFLMRQGFTLLWIGWQHNTPQRAGLMRAYLPTASRRGEPIRGVVRSEFFVTEPQYHHSLGDRGHIPYSVADPHNPENSMTVRERVTGKRDTIDRELWGFGRWQNGKVTTDRKHVYLKTGFKPGNIYEVVYEAQDPVVAGLGMMAIRDAVSFLKYGSPQALSIPERSITRAIGYGYSQSGRLLRNFLYDDLNGDEERRKVFDGMMSHTGGSARGSFNHRFAQPSRAIDFNFFYPTDMFPFHGKVQTDPVTGITDGLQADVAPDLRPKVFYTNSAMEYWIRPTALIHTTSDGTSDSPPLDNVRIFHFAGTQHIAAPFPPPVSFGELKANPNDYRWFMRALLMAMQAWISDKTPPPPSRYPTLSDGSLVPLEDLDFPDIPGVDLPRETPTTFALDYGPRFRDQGIITIEPPKLGAAYPKLVPQVDASGNEIGGLRSPELVVPLATYAGWRPFKDFYVPVNHGIYIPFAVSKSTRKAKGDPRPSIEERYSGRAQYLGLISEAAMALIDQDYLLEADLSEILREATRRWEHLASED